MSSAKFWSHVAGKAYQAANLIRNSIGEQGFFAGSGDRYQNQYWTRDFGLALAPAVGSIAAIYGANHPVHSGLESAIDDHLVSLAHRQGKSGAIPILYADFPELLIRKVREKGSFDFANRTLSVGSSFVLGRIFDGMFGNSEQFPEFADFDNLLLPRRDPQHRAQRGLYRLTPGTKDSELLFALAVLNHGGNFTPSTVPTDEDMLTLAGRAVEYMEDQHVRDGLMVGADWRDTMEKFFADRFLLSNNAIRYQVHKLLRTGKHEEIARRIDEVFWNGTTYLDYPGSERFDPLGAALAVLYDLVPTERYGAVMRGFESVDTDYGVTIKCRHNAYQTREEEVIERTDGVVVWPFVCGFAALAAFKMQDVTFALDQLAKMTEQEGFGEWYDPEDGAQYGEPLQGWSAALYLRVCEAAIEKGCVRRTQFKG